jgi:hypothetical protein
MIISPFGLEPTVVFASAEAYSCDGFFSRGDVAAGTKRDGGEPLDNLSG